MGVSAFGAVNVPEHHNHDSRDGLYVDPAFTPAAAAALTRDLTFSGSISGNVYAQPLYIEGGPGGKAMIIAVTESNNVYALDAADGSVIWQRNVGVPVPLASLPCGDISPLGITGTPVVDLPSRALLFDAMTTPDNGTTKKHLIYSLNVDTGTTNSGWPVDVDVALAARSPAFTSVTQNERGALAVVGGNVYVPYGGHAGDCGIYYGWMVGVPLNNPANVMAWVTPGRGGGMWAVGGPASDGVNPFIATGNTFGASVWSGGESIIRFQPGPVFSNLTNDYWAPTNWIALDSGDIDLGGSGALLVDVPGATPAQLVVSLGKDGNAYLLNRTNLGGVSAPVSQARVSSSPIRQAAATYRTALGTYVVFCGDTTNLSAFRIGATSPPTITSVWTVHQGGSGSPFVTSTDGASSAIVWGIGSEGDQRLHGFDGDTGAVVYSGSGANELMAGTRRFNTGIAARGRIFIANDNRVYAFKLSAGTQGGFTNSAVFQSAVAGTNLNLSYSLTTPAGWVTLLRSDTLPGLLTNPQPVTYAAAPSSLQGQFLIPIDPAIPSQYYRLLLEPWPTYYLNYPDLSDIIPTNRMSIVGTGTNRMFQYTHDTFNGGAGPLAIQPGYNPASGNYQGYQQIYFFISGVWALAGTHPVAGAFVFDVAHGHFHFPFSAYGLYAVNPDGSVGAPQVLSTKTGFCIADSFLYDSTLPNAGAFGNWGTCTDPTSLRGLSIGAVDEYDQTDEGQAIPIGNLPNGLYWLRAIVDPYNYLVESDKSNNETDVKLAITNNSLTVLQTVKPVLPPPPAISMTSPLAGQLSGTVQLTASTPINDAVGVQFLIDGLPFLNAVANAPYTLSWDTSTVPNGTHWLAARVENAAGYFGTSDVLQVTVTNHSTLPPVVQVTDPASNATVSAVVSVTATAVAQIGIPTVQFYVDGVALGSPMSAPPFVTAWDTQLMTAGSHTLTATATDQFGLSNTSSPVSVTVDNSHPPQPIGIDMTTFRDGADMMLTPAFSTSTAADLLVAFVAYDGPATASQTATVSGAGLPWQLAMRSNSQHGSAEIWVAKATGFLTGAVVTALPGITGSYHGTLTVLAFTNASGAGIVGRAGAPTGAPDIYLPGVFAGNWVFAVGNDWDKAIGRTPVSGQVLVHQRIDTQSGDTFWVQSTAAPSLADGLVDIHDTAPTTDQWNYAAVEIVATRQ